MTWIKWKLISIQLEVVLISVQDKCTVCDECTTGMEIILGTPVGTPTWRVSFILVHLDIVLI
jgi:hypothetical protein